MCGAVFVCTFTIIYWPHRNDDVRKYAEIRTSAGEAILVDIVDLPKVQPYTWLRKAKNRGAVACVNGEMVDMHRFILGLEKTTSASFVVKHINGDKLDNRRSNLLLTTTGVTIATSNGKQRFVRNKSGFKGVSPITQHGKTRWRARISLNGKESSIGHFDTPEDAARAYDERIAEVYGAMAVTNKSLGLIK